MGNEDNYREKYELLSQEIENIKNWQSEVNQLLSQILKIVESNSAKQDETAQLLDAVKNIARVNRWRIESLPYELRDPDYQEKVVFKPHIMSLEHTRDVIINSGKSITRFGDGEFGVIEGRNRWKFQSANEKLGNRLREVLESSDDGILIGLNPNFYKNLSELPEEAADGVRSYMRPEIRRFHASLLKPDRVYADALFHSMETEDDVKVLRKIWDNRDCVFVEGQHTRMGVGNDLFNNAKSVERVLCPSENAFERYDEIFKEVLNLPKDRLIMIALGPTASVLAYDLYKEGYRAIDVGHLDLVYEKYMMGASSLNEVVIPYKYCRVDESGERREIESTADSTYESQVIARIY